MAVKKKQLTGEPFTPVPNSSPNITPFPQSPLNPSSTPLDANRVGGGIPGQPNPRVTNLNPQSSPEDNTALSAGIINRGGSSFVLPARELRNLARQGDLLPGETFSEQNANREQLDINAKLADIGIGEAKQIEALSQPDVAPGSETQGPQPLTFDRSRATLLNPLGQQGDMVSFVAPIGFGNSAGSALALGSNISSKLGSLGKLGGAVSVGSIITSFFGRGNQLEKDIKGLVFNSGQLVTEVKSGRLPAQFAITKINEIEEEVRRLAGELNSARSSSPLDLIKGKDAQVFLRQQLTALIQKRSALEAYLVTRDPNSLTAFENLPIEALLE